MRSFLKQFVSEEMRPNLIPLSDMERLIRSKFDEKKIPCIQNQISFRFIQYLFYKTLLSTVF